MGTLLRSRILGVKSSSSFGAPERDLGYVAVRRTCVLAIIWVIAPIVAAGLGFALTRLLDLVPAIQADAHVTGTTRTPTATRFAGRRLAVGLITVGALASFTMGSNDVANATGSLVGIGTFSPLAAGLIGGLGLAVGVLTWGKPLLRKVAFDIVSLDRPMATAAQLVQAVVVLIAVGFGFFTSMNQALIGAMAGAGAARGRHTVHAAALYGVLRGWIIGPGAGIALGYAITTLVAVTTGTMIVAQCTRIPAASPAPITVKTRIWMVEVGIASTLNALVSPNATPITITSPTTDNPAPSRRLCPTVCSTPWEANVAPIRASGAMIAKACQAVSACNACGMPMHAPV